MHSDHYRHSSLREAVLEHLFVADLMRLMWTQGRRDFEVLHALTDTRGYDLVLGRGGMLRHVQLKASLQNARTARQTVHCALAAALSGCVVWMWVHPRTLDFVGFGWFGGPPGEPLPPLGNRVARHTKADARGVKAPRPNLRVLPRAAFEPLPDLAAVAERLFGPL